MPHEAGDTGLEIASRGRGSADLLAVLEDLAELVGGDQLDVMDRAVADLVTMVHVPGSNATWRRRRHRGWLPSEVRDFRSLYLMQIKRPKDDKLWMWIR